MVEMGSSLKLSVEKVIVSSICLMYIVCLFMHCYRLLWRKRCAVGIWPNTSVEWLRWERQRENVNVLELSNANSVERERGINEDDELLVAVQRSNSLIAKMLHWEKWSEELVSWRKSLHLGVKRCIWPAVLWPSCNLIPSPWHVQKYNCQGVCYVISCSAVFAKWSVLISYLLLSHMTCLVISIYLITF